MTKKRIAVSGVLSLIAFFVLATTFLFLHKDNKPLSFESLRNIKTKTIVQSIKNTKRTPYETIYAQGVHIPIRKTPIDWNWHYASVRSDNFYLHSWDMINDDLHRFNDTHKKSELVASIAIADDWIKNNKPELKNNQDTNFAWYDMAVGVRLQRLSYIFDEGIRNNMLSQNQIHRMWNSIVDHFSYLGNDKNIIYHTNHGLYQVAGQIAAARRLNVVNKVTMQSIYKSGQKRVARIISTQFTDEGIQKEHSPSYHIMVYKTLLALETAGLIDAKYSTQLANIRDNICYMVKPDNKLLTFGDSELTDESSQDCKKVKKLKLFNDSGFGVYKDDDSYLAIQGAFHSRTHKHADDLTISWFENGEDVLIDAGKYGYVGQTTKDSQDWRDGFYYSDKSRQFIEKTRAHNTIEIDGKDFLRKGVKPFGSAIVGGGKTDDVYYIQSRVSEFKTVGFERTLLYKPNEWLIVLDMLEDKNQHNYKQWFHAAPAASAENVSNDMFKVTTALQTIYVRSLNENRSSAVISGQSEPYVQGWYAPSTSKLEKNDAFYYQNKGKNVVFATLFSVDEQPKVQSSNFEVDKGSASWVSGGDMHLVSYQRNNKGLIQVGVAD